MPIRTELRSIFTTVIGTSWPTLTRLTELPAQYEDGSPSARMFKTEKPKLLATITNGMILNAYLPGLTADFSIERMGRSDVNPLSSVVESLLSDQALGRSLHGSAM